MRHATQRLAERRQYLRTNQFFTAIDRISAVQFLYLLGLTLFVLSLVITAAEFALQGTTLPHLLQSRHSYLELNLVFLGAFLNIMPQGVQFTALGAVVFLLQVLIGYFLLVVAAAFFVSKAIRPAPSTLILSRRAFYVVGAKRFGVLAVNTSSGTLTNLRFLAVFRFGRRHAEPAEFALPYLSDSALFFFLMDWELAGVEGTRYDPNMDGLKVSVGGDLGNLRCSAFGKYLCEDIVVVSNTDFMDRPLFESPNLGSKEFWDRFHDPLGGRQSLHDYVRERAAVVRP